MFSCLEIERQRAVVGPGKEIYLQFALSLCNYDTQYIEGGNKTAKQPIYLEFSIITRDNFRKTIEIDSLLEISELEKPNEKND